MTGRHAARHARVTFLGTSSGAPTLTRGLPSLVLRRGPELLLFDCGEGTQLQFRKAGLRPGRLSRVFISHLHGDHVLGLPGFLMSLQLGGRATPLEIHGPPGIAALIQAVLRLVEAHIGYELRIFEHGAAETVARGDGYEIECRPLDHRAFCLGYALIEAPVPGTLDVARARALGVPDGPLMGRLKRGEAVTLSSGTIVVPAQVVAPARRGLRVAYCTDTRPRMRPSCSPGTPILDPRGHLRARPCRGCACKGHCTAHEAAEIAVRAGARQLALTHISPRYRDPAPLLSDAQALFPNTVIAADLMALEVSA